MGVVEGVDREGGDAWWWLEVVRDLDGTLCRTKVVVGWCLLGD